MKILLIIPLVVLPGILFGQSTVTRSIPINTGEQVNMTFTYPEQVSIEVWDRETIQVDASVSINRGENDDAFQINVDNTGGMLDISTEIVNKDDLPDKIICHYNGQDHYFNTGDWSHPDVKAFINEHGRENIKWISHGPEIDISIKILVPTNIALNVNSEFSLIEMKGVTQSLTINSEHGGVDLGVPRSTSHDLEIACEWGTVYTNLDLEIETTKNGKMLKAEKFNAKLNGGGQLISLNSEHGNIYLRAME